MNSFIDQLEGWHDDSVRYILLQETKLRHVDAPDARRRLAKFGWTLHPGICAATEKGGRSAGVALLARVGDDVGDVMSACVDLGIKQSPRMSAWLINAGPPGGTLLLSMYLHDSVGPWHADNAAVMEQARQLIRIVGKPFCLAADWNAEPQEVKGCGFPEAVDGCVMHDMVPTCITTTKDGKRVEKNFDYFLVSNDIATSTNMSLYEGLTFNPHTAVRMELP